MHIRLIEISLAKTQEFNFYNSVKSSRIEIYMKVMTITSVFIFLNFLFGKYLLKK